MQVALPRTQDAGKLQEQMSKQNQRFQESLAQSQLQEERLKRTQVNESEETIKSEWRDEDEKEEPSEGETDSENSKKGSKQEMTNHPYLGNNIDFSG